MASAVTGDFAAAFGQRRGHTAQTTPTATPDGEKTWEIHLRCNVFAQGPKRAEGMLLDSLDDVAAEIYVVGEAKPLDESSDDGEGYEIRLRCVTAGESRRGAELALLSQLDDVPAEIYLTD